MCAHAGCLLHGVRASMGRSPRRGRVAVRGEAASVACGVHARSASPPR